MSKSVEELEAVVAELTQTNTDLVESVNKLETANADLVKDRTDLKQKLKDNSGDDTLKAELENYKQQLEAADQEKETLGAEYSKEINSLRMAQTLKEMNIKTPNADALAAVGEILLSEVDTKDGAFVFLNEDGSTKFNEAKKPYSIQDKVNELKEGDKSYLFAQETGGGATGNGATHYPQKKTRTEMTLQEKIEYRTTNGEEAYLSLPLA